MFSGIGISEVTEFDQIEADKDLNNKQTKSTEKV